jgi:hypothetical protein
VCDFFALLREKGPGRFEIPACFDVRGAATGFIGAIDDGDDQGPRRVFELARVLGKIGGDAPDVAFSVDVFVGRRLKMIRIFDGVVRLRGRRGVTWGSTLTRAPSGLALMKNAQRARTDGHDRPRVAVPRRQANTVRKARATSAMRHVACYVRDRG